jgi:hypothetical protein
VQQSGAHHFIDSLLGEFHPGRGSQLGGAGNVLRERPAGPRALTWVSLLGRSSG